MQRQVKKRRDSSSTAAISPRIRGIKKNRVAQIAFGDPPMLPRQIAPTPELTGCGSLADR